MDGDFSLAAPPLAHLEMCLGLAIPKGEKTLGFNGKQL